MIYYNVKKDVSRKELKEFILNKHYAQRMPAVSYSYGLYHDEKLVGVLTIGKPASNSLCVGLCGEKWSKNVYELNRLVVDEGLPKNTLSFFVSKVLKDLKSSNLILVSYADEGMGHHGYVYQATNWIYTGKTRERTDKYMPNNKHSRHYTEEYSHLRKFRSSKYRYIYILNKKMKKEILKDLKYSIESYPKGENSRYVLGQRAKTKILNKKTGEIFYE